jgi:hypothetical protein
VKKVLKPLLGFVGGGVLGCLYYFFVGCKSGSCAITSNPWLSILWGAIFGLILLFPTKKDDNKRNNN